MITVNRLQGEIGTIGFVIVVDNVRNMKEFQELVQRGANLWPDASPEIKTFADLITNGKELQPYSKMWVRASPEEQEEKTNKAAAALDSFINEVNGESK